jgi:DNA repair protein NreA
MQNKKQLYSNPKNFVFEKNYPNLSLGPTTYLRKDLAQRSSPKKWIDKDFNEAKKEKNSQIIVYNNFNKISARNPNKSLEDMQLLAQSLKTTEIEANINRFTRVVDNFSGINNYGYLSKNIKIIDNIKIPKVIDKTVNDKDLKAVDGVIQIYNRMNDVYKIQDVFSIGLLGLKKNRVLVPTKWTITSVDDIVSKKIILDKLLYFPTIDDFQVFYYRSYKNRFVVLLLPENWGFENIEITTDLKMSKDFEISFPKKKYAFSVTGGYYSTRLSVCEYLEKIKKQARVIVFREIDKDYKSEGVWLIRESVKKAMKEIPKKFDSLSCALKEVSKYLIVDINYYKKESKILEEFKKQKRMIDYF